MASELGSGTGEMVKLSGLKRKVGLARAFKVPRLLKMLSAA